MVVSKAQQKARNKWDAEHRDKKNKSVAKSKAKKFIMEYADNSDLEWVKGLINERRRNDGN